MFLSCSVTIRTLVKHDLILTHDLIQISFGISQHNSLNFLYTYPTICTSFSCPFLPRVLKGSTTTAGTKVEAKWGWEMAHYHVQPCWGTNTRGYTKDKSWRPKPLWFFSSKLFCSRNQPFIFKHKKESIKCYQWIWGALAHFGKSVLVVQKLTC